MSTRTELPLNPLADHIESRGKRFRVRTRSRFVGGSFNLVNAVTRYEIEGRENLFAAIERSCSTGRGLITVSNHLSLFDDPMVLIKLLKLRNFNVETKAWWSTACASNFHPDGRSVGSKAVRAFSETANMVFMERAHKGCQAHVLPESLAEAMKSRIGWKRWERLEERARRDGTGVETFLRRFVTVRPGAEATSLDQLGVLEACTRIQVGDWLHFFPEGGRSRNLALRPARPGVGKVIFHSPDADVVPICFYGTQDVLPVGAVVPRPFKRVVVSVGRPVNRSVLESLRRAPAGTEAFSEVSRFVMSAVAALRPGVLARYLGTEAAFHLLAEEQADVVQYPVAAVAAAVPAAEPLPWTEAPEVGVEVHTRNPS
jgi:1-acyl-sn-glycerol-3-phosphate acyltransferase